MTTAQTPYFTSVRTASASTAIRKIRYAPLSLDGPIRMSSSQIVKNRLAVGLSGTNTMRQSGWWSSVQRNCSPYQT